MTCIEEILGNLKGGKFRFTYVILFIYINFCKLHEKSQPLSHSRLVKSIYWVDIARFDQCTKFTFYYPLAEKNYLLNIFSSFIIFQLISRLEFAIYEMCQERHTVKYFKISIKSFLNNLDGDSLPKTNRVPGILVRLIWVLRPPNSGEMVNSYIHNSN